MHVLIVTQYFWPEDFRINDLAQGLTKAGHRVTVLTGKPNYPTGRFFDGYSFWAQGRDTFSGMDVIRVPLIPRYSGRGFRLGLNYLSFALFASLLAPFRVRGTFDVIFVYEPSPITVGLPALVLKRLTRAPILFWVQDLWPESLSATGAVRSKWVLGLVASLVSFIYKNCDMILVQSHAFINRVCALEARPERVRYFPNTAEEFYRPIERSECRSVEALPEGFRVMFAGNVGAAQSFDTILAAAEELRDRHAIHWIILGEGRQFGWVKEEIVRRRLSHCVHLLGRHPVESMSEWFAQADVLLVTLKKNPIFALTIPSKVQSYMACGRPIVAALDGEGARVVEEAGAGIAVPAEDAMALASAVMRFSEMPLSEREAKGQNGRRYFLKEFDRDALIARLDSWINEVAGGK